MRRWPKKPKQPPYRQEQTQHAARDRYDKATLAIAVIGLIVLIIYTTVTGYQTVLTRRAVTVAVDQQRAWLKTSAKPKIGLLVWTKGGATTLLEMTATNVGAVPATGVTFEAKLLPFPTGGRTPEMGPSYLDICRADFTSIGQTAFPGETITSIYNEEDASVSPQVIRKAAAGSSKVGFIVRTCAQYKSGVSGPVHRTVQTYMIFDKDGGAPILFDIDGSAIQKQDLILQPIGVQNRAN